MARLYEDGLVVPAASLGQENPHAALWTPIPMVATYEGAEIVSHSCLPYRLQDGYNRTLAPRRFRAIILESDRLKATVLPEIGGRLWSLLHKPSGRDLLHVNENWQPANIAVRNAWVSGGVEWNPGIYGHTVFTNDPVYAGEIEVQGGVGLRIWEYERLRGTPWSVDLWVLDGSDYLFIAPRIVNPNDEAIPMYWWTCIAYPEHEGTKVLAPARFAIEPDHAAGVDVRKDLEAEPDLTIPSRRDHPRDVYFEIPAGRRPWIAAVEPEGYGTVHVSSARLKGRKMWVWGMGPNGRRWQSWLAHGATPYIEIQGGLARKQNEYVRMPAGADWSWLEAIGPTGPDVERRLEADLPEAKFEELAVKVVAGQKRPVRKMAIGSGWGSLEQERRRLEREPALVGPEMPFEPSGDTDSWQALLEHGSMPDSQEPGSYMIDLRWQKRLRLAADKGGWLPRLHLGVMMFAAGRFDGAEQAWKSSLEAKQNGWATRNLALLAKVSGQTDSIDSWMRAQKLLPDDPHLVDELCRELLAAGRFARLREFVETLAGPLATRPRVRLSRAVLAMAQGDAAQARAYFDQEFDLFDIRENERTVTELWSQICDALPRSGDPAKPPADYDFRMHA